MGKCSSATATALSAFRNNRLQCFPSPAGGTAFLGYCSARRTALCWALCNLHKDSCSWSNSSCTCQDFYPRSSSPFLHRLLSYTGCNTEAVTCSNPLTLQIADKQIKICFNMYALSGVSWWVRKFVYCWQCLMEAAAITCEGPAIFSKSQTKIQPWRQVVGCSLYINPQLPCFKVNEVFRASEVV